MGHAAGNGPYTNEKVSPYLLAQRRASARIVAGTVAPARCPGGGWPRPRRWMLLLMLKLCMQSIFWWLLLPQLTVPQLSLSLLRIAIVL